MSPTPLLLLLLLCGTCYCSCPDSWTPYGSSCYVVIKQPLTWIDAAALCVALGGNLVEINNPSENNFVWTTLTSHNVPEAWIGINDLAQEGRWVLTFNGRALSFTNWWPGEPNNQKGNENGGEIWKGGTWNDTPTSRELPSVCERNCSPCPPSWTQYERSCYAYIPHSLTWSDAASLCRTLGGYLVQITSAAENSFVRSLIGGKSAWLGINDFLQDGRWVLTTTGQPLSYSNWDAGQPSNNGGTETCGEMYSTGLWHDNTISSQMPSVCERSATPFMVS